MSIIKRKAGSEDIVKSVLTFDEVPTEGSPNMVESGAVAGAIAKATALGEESMMANLPIGANTLRFSFGDLDYDPTVAGVGSSGTWTKKNTKFTNVWDWTNEDTDWHESFKGAFPDEDNPVEVIAAGDTSSVTTMEKMFAGTYSGSPGNSNYSLITRNNIVSCVPFNISACSDISAMFLASSLRKFVQFDYSGNTTIETQTLCFDTLIEEIGDVHLSGCRIASIFSRCSKLKKVGNIECFIPDFNNSGQFQLFGNSSNFDAPLEEVGNISVTGGSPINYSTMFQHCHHLKKVGSIDCSSGTDFTAMFNNCWELEEIPELIGIGNSSITSVYNMFNKCESIKELPLFDTSHATNVRSFIAGCYEVETIPDYDFSSVTNTQNFARTSYKMKYGILETYDKFVARGAAITNHADAFTDCGRDTEEGRAALAQIPVSWGGTMETA